jgi:uroporphyrinogen-III decarboxylase
MTSRERVHAAINHQQPDRVPVDLGAMRASSINVTLYQKIKQRMGLATPTRVIDHMSMLPEVEPEVLERFHVDVVPLDTPSAAWCETPVERGQKWTLFSGDTVFVEPQARRRIEKDGSWVLLNPAGEVFARMPKDGFYFDFVRSTMSTVGIDPAKCRPSSTVSDEELEVFARRAKDLYENTDKAILGWGASISFFGLSALLSENITQGSLDDWLCLLMTEKETATEMMTRCTDAAIARTKLYHQAAGDRVMIWGVASDDAGTQRAGLIRPELFDELIKPHYVRFNDWVHKNTSWKTFLHSCGAVHDYLPGWIESGIDIINPVQIAAAGMEPQRLMKDFGGRIVFWGGGADTQQVLPTATPAEVRSHVKENIAVFGSRPGGYVFNQVHNLQPHVSPENVEAMFDAAYEFGGR